MGSFDMACAITGISLGLHQPVKMFFIVKTEQEQPFVYPNDCYEFCSFGIDMVYDDYSNYMFDEKSPEWIDFINRIKNHAVHTPLGENKYHDLEFDPKNKEHYKPEYLFHVMSKGRLFFKPYFHEEKNLMVQPYPIHAEVYDYIINKKYEHYVGYDGENEKGIYEMRGLEYMVKSVTEKVKKEREFKREIYEKSKIDMPSKSDHFPDIYSIHVVGLNEVIDGIRFLFDQVLEGLLTEKQLIQKIAEFKMLFDFLLEQAIAVFPTIGAGQELNYKSKRHFSSFVAQLCLDLNKKYSDEYGDEDEDED